MQSSLFVLCIAARRVWVFVWDGQDRDMLQASQKSMPGGMVPLKKPRNPTKLPLALNPTKSKDVLAVLAERNQAIIPVGAWVEPASPNWSGIPAHVSVSWPGYCDRCQPFLLAFSKFLVLKERWTAGGCCFHSDTGYILASKLYNNDVFSKTCFIFGWHNQILT